MIQNEVDEAEGKLNLLWSSNYQKKLHGTPRIRILVQNAAFEHICSVYLSTAWVPAFHLSERALSCHCSDKCCLQRGYFHCLGLLFAK